MCTTVILRQPGARWPLLFAANRDEMADRPWSGPDRHWPHHPDTIAGIDRLAGGTWLGLNRAGLVAALLNRQGSLGPEPGRRSRGQLVLDALDCADALTAATRLATLDPAAYRPFNLVLADRCNALCLLHRVADGRGAPEVQRLPEGLTLVTGFDPDDARDARIRHYRPRFAAAPTPCPETNDWTAWKALLAAQTHEDGTGANGAMCFRLASGFGTVCSSLIALPAARPAIAPGHDRACWLFNPSPPDQAFWSPIDLT